MAHGDAKAPIRILARLDNPGVARHRELPPDDLNFFVLVVVWEERILNLSAAFLGAERIFLQLHT